MTAYFWPVVTVAMAVVLLAAFSGFGVHAIVTKPITTPAERRERRLRLEADVRAAEVEAGIIVGKTK